jgi:hypothetical protein
MKEINLTQGQFTLVDDEDYKYLMQWKWQAKKNCNGYYAIHSYYAGKINNKKIYKYISMHNLIIKPPKGMQCDHVFHNTLDNRKFIEIDGIMKPNLRICTTQQNNCNKTSIGKSKYLGVGFSYKNSYKQIQVRISSNRKRIYLGTFKTEEDAAKAYDKKALELHGEFANLNFK